MILDDFHFQDFSIWVHCAMIWALIGSLMIPWVPIMNELIVECTYPIGAALSSGLVWIVINVFEVISFQLFYGLAVDIEDPEILQKNTCNIAEGSEDKPQDFTVGISILCGLCTASYLCLILFFKCPWLRRAVDQQDVSDA